jgi:lipoate-protein ligase B
VALYNLGRVPYVRAWDLQRAHVEGQVAGSVGDGLMVLEHDPVYTLGRGATLDNVLYDAARWRELGAPECIRVDRGGEVTYHGPGQLVAYPLVNLTHFKKDVRWFVCRMEDVVIRTLGSFGLEGKRVEVGRPGEDPPPPRNCEQTFYSASERCAPVCVCLCVGGGGGGGGGTACVSHNAFGII